MDDQIKQPEPTLQEPIISQEPPISEPEIKLETPVLEPQPEPQPEPEPSQPTTQSKEYQQILDQYAASQPQPPVAEAQIEPPRQDTPEYNIPTAPQTNIFKIIFIITLLFFILVFAALGYTYFKSKNSSTIDNLSSKNSSPTPVSSATCSLNDKIYTVGQSFPSADGCNTCSCTESKQIVCTEKACAPTPTKIATSSSQKDTRTLIAPSSDGLYHTDTSKNTECKNDFVLSDTSTTVSYIDKINGISFDMPFDSSWGTAKYRLNQYDKIGTTKILFGKLTMATPSCYGQRILSLEILPPATEAQISTRNADNFTELKMVQIGNLNIATYGDLMSSSSQYEIIGKNHNYRFFGYGFTQQIENIIKTVKLN